MPLQPNAAWRALYPFASQYLNLDGHQYHYVDHGFGRPLLMVHGNPTWSFYWRDLITELGHDYRVIAVDHLGCGLSDKPQQYDYCLQRHTENLIQLVDRLNLDQTSLLAHDWGGAIGLGAVMQRPDRFREIVLLNTGAFPPPRVPRRIAICRTPWLGTFALRGLNLFCYAAFRMATAKPKELTPAVRAGYLAPYDSWRHRIAIDHFVKDIPLSERHPTWQLLQELEAQLPQWSPRRVQLVWGMRDWCFDNACLQRFQRIWPHAETHRLPDAGHWVVEDARDEVLTLVRAFLEH